MFPICHHCVSHTPLTWDEAVFKHKLARRRTPHAELIQLGRRREPRHVLLYEESRDAVLRLTVEVSLGVDDQNIRDGAVGDPELGACP